MVEIQKRTPTLSSNLHSPPGFAAPLASMEGGRFEYNSTGTTSKTLLASRKFVRRLILKLSKSSTHLKKYFDSFAAEYTCAILEHSLKRVKTTRQRIRDCSMPENKILITFEELFRPSAWTSFLPASQTERSNGNYWNAIGSPKNFQNQSLQTLEQGEPKASNPTTNRISLRKLNLDSCAQQDSESLDAIKSSFRINTFLCIGFLYLAFEFYLAFIWWPSCDTSITFYFHRLIVGLIQRMPIQVATSDSVSDVSDRITVKGTGDLQAINAESSLKTRCKASIMGPIEGIGPHHRAPRVERNVSWKHDTSDLNASERLDEKQSENDIPRQSSHAHGKKSKVFPKSPKPSPIPSFSQKGKNSRKIIIEPIHFERRHSKKVPPSHQVANQKTQLISPASQSPNETNKDKVLEDVENCLHHTCSDVESAESLIIHIGG
ncbi:hypothetical protein O181_016836 [Austropuccinia psidii MF-1]|uniref:Uncharacterized protein n=1 Tax=Austropuccinia psidii MF-1 TaxID=1389203 RepID=A0A9Q3C2G5_9BASI|nr:hypothetical protein [Austropuccinia psidii MF-1]